MDRFFVEVSTVSLVLWSLSMFFWAASLCIVALRTRSEVMSSLAKYGGRSGNCNHSGAHAVGSVTSVLGFLTTTVSRKTSFQCFYLTGCATCSVIFCAVIFAADNQRSVVDAALLSTTGLLFWTHCSVRWVETSFRQAFRSSDVDRVSLFALVSGCVFYVVAALSCFPLWLFDGYDVVTASRNAHFTPFVAVSSYLIVQCLQVVHHEILREQRCGSKHRRVGGCGPYRYPRRGLFHVVQEPHYLCEVIMYVVCCVAICEQSGSWPIALPCAMLTIFSAFNLSVTAQEHRQYWLRVKERVPRWRVLPLVY